MGRQYSVEKITSSLRHRPLAQSQVHFVFSDVVSPAQQSSFSHRCSGHHVPRHSASFAVAVVVPLIGIFFQSMFPAVAPGKCRASPQGRLAYRCRSTSNPLGGTTGIPRHAQGCTWNLPNWLHGCLLCLRKLLAGQSFTSGKCTSA